MRRNYTKGSLDESSVSIDPLVLFKKWFSDAMRSEKPPSEPNAMALATVDQYGYPHCRMVLMKGLDSGHFVFFTNFNSAKSLQLFAKPFAAMTFFWPSLERQVRIEGSVFKGTYKEANDYYQERPLGSRISAQASPQSSVISGQEKLRKLYALTEKKFDVDKIPLCPTHWGCFKLRPNRMEFWQGRSSRLHDRLNYRKVNSVWIRERLAP